MIKVVVLTVIAWVVITDGLVTDSFLYPGDTSQQLMVKQPHSPSANGLRSSSPELLISTPTYPENHGTKDDPKQLQNKYEKLELKTRQQTTMINEQKNEVEKLTAKVGQQKSTISSLKKSLNYFSTECEKQKDKSRKVVFFTASLLRKCEQKLNASEGFELIDGCPPTFTNDKKAGICFGIVKKLANYNNAKIDCEKTYHGRLAILNTVAKLDAVRGELFNGHQSVWIGGEQQGSTFVWVDGSTISRSFGWAPNEPNDDKERCVNLYPDLDFKMNDYNCDYAISYVCEVPK